MAANYPKRARVRVTTRTSMLIVLCTALMFWLLLPILRIWRERNKWHDGSHVHVGSPRPIEFTPVRYAGSLVFFRITALEAHRSGLSTGGICLADPSRGRIAALTHRQEQNTLIQEFVSYARYPPHEIGAGGVCEPQNLAPSEATRSRPITAVGTWHTLPSRFVHSVRNVPPTTRWETHARVLARTKREDASQAPI